MKGPLLLLFAAVMLTVIGVNVWAGQQVSVFDSWPGFAANRWAIATLVDAYCGFLVFYVWVAWRERSWASRVLWFALIMGLGNITAALYVILALARLPQGRPAWTVLLRPGMTIPGSAVAK